MAFYAGCLDHRIKVIVASDFGIGWDQTNWNEAWYWGDRLKDVRARGMDHSDLLSLAGGKYTPGAERRIAFRFADHAFRIEKGDVLRVDVASANSQFAPHPNVAGDAFACACPKVAHNTVFPGRSFLGLPASPADEE